MIDNRKVKDDHQEGIARKLQKKSDMKMGEKGKMSQSPKEKANWKRPDSASTPRKA